MRASALSALLLLCLPSGATAASGAAIAPNLTPPKKVRLLLLPTKRFVRSDLGLEQDIDKALQAALAPRQGLELVAPAKLRQAVQGQRLYADRLALARAQAEDGSYNHERMRLKVAVERLEKARALYEVTLQRWASSQEVADTLLTLALAHLEQGDRNRAHLALKELLFIEPFRVLKEGYYSPRAISAFGVARTDFLNAEDYDLPLGRVQRLGKLVDARYVLFPYLRNRARAAPALVVVLYDVTEGRMIEREVIPVAKQGTAWEVDRLASRLMACLSYREARSPAEPAGPQRFSRHVGALLDGSIFALRPVREVFVSVGLDLRVDLELGPYLVAVGRFGYARSTGLRLTVEDYQDMRNELVSGTLFAGVGPRLASRHGGISAHAVLGLQGMMMGSVRISRDPGCKWGPPYRCSDRVHDPVLALGPSAAVGLSWALMGPLALQVELAVAYLAGYLQANELNLPLRAAIGLVYGF